MPAQGEVARTGPNLGRSGAGAWQCGGMWGPLQVGVVIQGRCLGDPWAAGIVLVALTLQGHSCFTVLILAMGESDLPREILASTEAKRWERCLAWRWFHAGSWTLGVGGEPWVPCPCVLCLRKRGGCQAPLSCRRSTHPSVLPSEIAGGDTLGVGAALSPPRVRPGSCLWWHLEKGACTPLTGPPAQPLLSLEGGPSSPSPSPPLPLN